MDLQLQGKVFLVAGASKGLGYAIAERLCKEGALVSIAGSNLQRINDAADRLNTVYGEDGKDSVIGYHCDVNNAEQIQDWISFSVEQFSRIDGLVVNAGGPPAGRFEDFDDEQWLQAFNLTLMSAIRMIRAVLPIMRQQGGGAILTLTSSSVKEPIDFLLLSNVMRSGVTSLAKSLSRTEASYGIRVNNLVPGLIETDRMKGLDQMLAKDKGVSVEEQGGETSKLIPLGRYGQPEEFADAAAFLLSESASYITGATLTVDGGSMKTVW